MTTDLLWHMATATERPGVDRVGAIGRVRACGIHLWCPSCTRFFVGITELLLWAGMLFASAGGPPLPKVFSRAHFRHRLCAGR